MTIEKVFAIRASPEEIWEALWTDVLGGDESAFVTEQVNRPSTLVLRLDMGGMPCVLSYRLTPGPDHTEVAAMLEPTGLRYSLYLILTLGHIRRNYEMLLVQGLANLKAAVEPEGLENDLITE